MRKFDKPVTPKETTVALHEAMSEVKIVPLWGNPYTDLSFTQRYQQNNDDFARNVCTLALRKLGINYDVARLRSEVFGGPRARLLNAISRLSPSGA